MLWLLRTLLGLTQHLGLNWSARMADLETVVQATEMDTGVMDMEAARQVARNADRPLSHVYK